MNKSKQSRRRRDPRSVPAGWEHSLPGTGSRRDEGERESTRKGWRSPSTASITTRLEAPGNPREPLRRSESWTARQRSGNESDWEPRGRGFDAGPPPAGDGSSIAVSWGEGHRHGSDLVLLRLRCRPAATALIRPPAWEPPYAAGAALKSKKKKKQKIRRREELQELVCWSEVSDF